MIKPVLRIAVVIVVATVATIIVAQEVDEPSVVKPVVLAGRSNLEKAVKQADADYHKRLEPSEKGIRALRCRSVIATCKRTIIVLERLAAAATKDGADVEAAMARDKIATVKEYLDKAQADMPQSTVKPKPASIKLVNINGAKIKFGRHSYLAIFRKTTWSQADRMARAYGGYLATVETSAELMFLVEVARTHAWIGGEPGGEPLQWQWRNGRKISGTFWAGEMPTVRSDHRVVMSDKGLRINEAEKCADAFIIEWDR
jgi:hypothetical protein